MATDPKITNERNRIIWLPYKVHCKLAYFLDRPPGKFNWRAMIEHSLPDFSAADVYEIEEAGSKKGQSYTRILLRKMDNKGYTVADLERILRSTKVIEQGLNELELESLQQGRPRRLLQEPVQESMRSGIQERAATLKLEEPKPTKIPREHDDIVKTGGPLNRSSSMEDWHQGNEIQCNCDNMITSALNNMLHMLSSGFCLLHSNNTK